MPGASDISGIAQQALGSVGRLTSLGRHRGRRAHDPVHDHGDRAVRRDGAARLRARAAMDGADRPAAHEFAMTLERMGGRCAGCSPGGCSAWRSEGVLTWIALLIGGVPMALMLGIITGILAFIPNIGAFVTRRADDRGRLQRGHGHRAVGDRHLFRRADLRRLCADPDGRQATVDLPPALTLGAQILASALFGMLGLALADPMVAMIKVALERAVARRPRSEDARDAGPARLLALVGGVSRADRAQSEGGRIRAAWREPARGRAARRENRALNPQGFVPTLEVDGGVLTQSLAIIDWLDATYPEPPLIPRIRSSGRGRWRRRWWSRRTSIRSTICACSSGWRRQFGADQAARDDWYRHWIAEGFAALEAMAAARGRSSAARRRHRRRVPGAADVQRAAVRHAAGGLSEAGRGGCGCAAIPAFAAAHPDRVKPA